MLESGDKAQLAGAGAVQQRALRHHFDEDVLCSNVLFLGVVSRSKPRSSHQKEADRVAVALECLQVLGSLRLSTAALDRYAKYC